MLQGLRSGNDDIIRAAKEKFRKEAQEMLDTLYMVEDVLPP